MMHLGDFLVIILMIGNLVLLSILMWIYGRNYRKFESNFALGLLLFTIFLFFQGILNILSVIYYDDLIQNKYPLIENLYVLIPICEFIALSILLKVTWK
jgi:hypothetical protein